MKRMTFVLALIVLMLASPLYIGMQIEKEARAAIGDIQWPGYQFSLQVDRGYRHSQYQLQIQFDQAYFLGDDMSPEQRQMMQEMLQPLVLPIRLEHGPLIFDQGIGFAAAGFSMSLNSALGQGMAEFLQQAGLASLGSVSGEVQFSGDIWIESQLQPFSYVRTLNGVPLGSLQFNGLQSRFYIGNWGQSQTASSEIQPISLEFGPPGERTSLELGVQQVSAAFQRIENTQFLFSGQIQWDTGQVSWSNAQTQGSLQQVGMLYQSGPASVEGALDMSYQFSAAGMQIGETEYSNLQMGLAYLDIDAQVIETYIRLVMSIDPSDEEAMQLALADFASQQLPLLLQSDPGFALDPLQFTRGDQSFSAALELRVDGDMVVLPINPVNPAGLMYALFGHLSVEVDRELAEELLRMQVTSQVDQSIAANPDADVDPQIRETMISQQTAMLVRMSLEQGFIEAEDNWLKTRINLSNGLLDINGFQMPIPF